MRKLYLLLPIILFIGLSCEDILKTLSEEGDTIPPTVSISSHISDQTVNGIVTIIVTTEDNEGISKVEFYIDDSLVLTDSVSPYEYEWNTEQYENNSEHTVKVISYDNSDNSTESEPIVLVVYYPEVTLWGVVYSIEDTDSLDLQESGLTGPIPPEIGDLINLVYLNLDGSGVTGSIPSEIGNLTNLKYLYLGHNGLTGSIPSEIWNLTNLIEMDLYKFNELTGSIPPEIGNLTDLTYLNLRACGLTGSIPPEIGNLTSLELLWLAHNQLTGSIPPEIGNLTNLTDFQLYGNQLSGIVPDEICNMDISVLTDSYVFDNNQLCPPYPSCIEDGVGEQDTSNCN